MRVGMQRITSTRPTPDRFVYTVEYGDWRLTVPEQDLTPELRRLVQVVLNRGRNWLDPRAFGACGIGPRKCSFDR